MPASPIASNYPLAEQWAPLAVYGKRAPLWRKLRGQHKLTRKAKLWKRTVRNGKRRTRGLCLSPGILASRFESLTSNSDCCYHRLSVATVQHSYSQHRPLVEKAAGWICKLLVVYGFYKIAVSSMKPFGMGLTYEQTWHGKDFSHLGL